MNDEERQRSPWPWIVVALLGGHALLLLIAAKIALSQPSQVLPRDDRPAPTAPGPGGGGPLR